MMNPKQINRVLVLALLLGGLFSGLVRPEDGYKAPPLWKRSGGNTITNQSGNVGIGTLSPANKLDITGTASVSGNTGIGTTAPGSLLDIAGGSVTIRDSGSGGLQVGATDFVVTSAGNVGIGTSTPNASLDIKALGKSITVGTTDFIVTGGRVAVGTTTPRANAEFQGTATSTSVLIVSTGASKIFEVTPSSVIIKAPIVSGNSYLFHSTMTGTSPAFNVAYGTATVAASTTLTITPPGITNVFWAMCSQANDSLGNTALQALWGVGAATFDCKNSDAGNAHPAAWLVIGK